MTAKEFIEKAKSNIARHNLLVDGKPIIVGVSGGADSVALLSVLNSLGYACIAAHCNYHLRGEESNRDMRSVQDLCRALGIDLYVRDMDVSARRQATGESVEMACRELRYAWWYDMLDRQRAQAIAVAHHSEDNIETFMLNLMRGSGISGLSSMRWRNGYVVRPLLDFTRQEIEDYLREQGLQYVIDSTNCENVYSRNRLRNKILPSLESEFPGAMSGMLTSINNLLSNKLLYDEMVAEFGKRYFDGHRVLLSALVNEQPQHRVLLFELLHPYGFNPTQIDNMVAGVSRSGLSFVATNVAGFGHNSIKREVVAELDRGILTIRDRQNCEMSNSFDHEVSLRRDILTPVHILISEHPVTEFKPQRDNAVAYFDRDVLDQEPRFALRRWQRGDRMIPYGMCADKLLSDIYTNAKYSAEDKRNAWVLTRNDEIIWAVGLRQSSNYAVGPETRRYLRLELREKKGSNS